MRLERSTRTWRRLLTALGTLATITCVGTFGFYSLGGGRWKLGDCVYMTVMTITTVGFGEILEGFGAVPYARAFSTGLMIVGVSGVAYSATAVASALIEGDIKEALGVRRMERQLEKLKDHFIVCGAGTTGFHVVEELVGQGRMVCVVESSEERVRRVQEAFPSLPCVLGDATEDEILHKAGVGRAAGVFAALSQDKDNLFVVISARQLNRDARIVARAIDLKSVPKLQVGGANAIVSPNFLGGRRMASEMLRPHVVAFMDVVTDRDKEFDIEEVSIPEGSLFAGKSLAEAKVRQVADVLVLAVHKEGRYRYNPEPSVRLSAGDRVLVLGASDAVESLRAALARV